MARVRRVKITKRLVDSLEHPDRGQIFHWDSELPGFGLCVGRTAKSYLVQRDMNGRTVRETIGKHGVFTPEEARREARERLLRMATGEDPREARRLAQAQAITLRQAWDEFRQARALATRTLKDYARVFDLYLTDWADRPLSAITPEMVVERYQAEVRRRGPSTAAGTMRVFRAVYNFALISRPELPPNPALRLSQLRLWHRDPRRRTYIRPADLPAWHAAVMALPNDDARDYLLLVLFTGMRRAEACRLRWEDIDLAGRTLTVPRTKHGDPLVLPLSGFLLGLLRERKVSAGDNLWVFPSDSASGHVEEPKNWVAAVARASGVQFGLHDLRRTFITVAEGLDLSAYALKGLLNHRDGDRDVTGGYIVLGVERLREPMERVSRRLLNLCAGTCLGGSASKPEERSAS